MASVGDFLSADFDAVTFVNNLCAQGNRSEHEGTLDKFLSEMEMRLQLSAEEIEASLQDSSNQALRRIPYAVQEIYRLQVREKSVLLLAFSVHASLCLRQLIKNSLHVAQASQARMRIARPRI
jgi:hypothetical protein